MATLVIWGEDDHKVRAEALATSYNTTAQKVTVKPRKVADLETLVFWGHGTSTEFCELDSDKFVALIAAWKKLNSKLKTIEMLTCNIRHKQGNKTDSYTEQVVKKLTNKQDHMNFRALPVLTTDNAVVCEFSILKYHAASATWAYVGAPGGDDNQMWSACVKLEDFMPPRGLHVGYPRAHVALKGFNALTTRDAYAIKRQLNQGAVDAYNNAMTAAKQNSFIITGNMSALRWCLVDIR